MMTAEARAAVEAELVEVEMVVEMAVEVEVEVEMKAEMEVEAEAEAEMKAEPKEAEVEAAAQVEVEVLERATAAEVRVVLAVVMVGRNPTTCSHPFHMRDAPTGSERGGCRARRAGTSACTHASRSADSTRAESCRRCGWP